MIKAFINKLFNSSNKQTAKTEAANKEGIVKFFNKTKGFGFISVKGTEEEIFVHKSNLIDKIRDKDQVTFDIVKDDKGLSAVNVRRTK